MHWLVILICATAWASEPILKAPSGTFRGTLLESAEGRPFYGFLGIPYALPPVGDFRFKEPIAIEEQAGTYDATYERDDCMQFDMAFHKYHHIDGEYAGSEDCLYLNVYTPKIEPGKLYPVIVAIHGGGYFYGSGSKELQGPELLMDRNIVLVSINYRLGVFGFFNLKGVVPGNLGLRDQSLALRWVQKNIAHFGGDPAKVTILGESAGSASVHQQMLSPLSKGLFARAISQSGTADSIWAMHNKEQARINALKFLDGVGCSSNKPEDILKCLQQKSALELIKQCSTMQKFVLDMVFRPVAEEESDNAFLTEASLLKGSTIPWIVGTTSGEGFCVVEEFFRKGLEHFEANYKELLPILFQYENKPDKDLISEKIKKFYIGSNAFSNETLKAMTKMCGDPFFYYGCYKSILNHNGPVYAYYFAYQGQESFYDLTLTTKYDLGVNHGDDYYFIFHVKKFVHDVHMSEQDSKISKNMIDMWTKFASDGSPVPDEKWPDVKKSQKIMLFSKYGDISIQDQTIDESMYFWDNLLHLTNNKDEL